MTTTIFRNVENMGNTEILNEFKKTLTEQAKYFTEKKVNYLKQNEIEEMAETYAKNMVNKFIVLDKDLEGTFCRQGDILFWQKGSENYDREINNVTWGEDTDRMVLQEGDAMTGDHKIIPLKNSKVKITKGKFVPEILKSMTNSWTGRGMEYNCLRVVSDKPFLVVHREHGNMVLPSGEYMVCTQLNPKTLQTM